MRKISNSEVSSYLSCERRYNFEYVHNIEPKQYSGPITKGILIHAILETYYTSLSEGMSHEDAVVEAMNHIMNEMAQGKVETDEAFAVRALIQGYFETYPDDNDRYEVVAVESVFLSKLTEDFAMPGTIDLLWRERETGKHWVVDHKSSYNFFSDEQIAMSVQFPKYVYLLRDAGFDVEGVIINQLRTRNVKNGDLYKRAYIKPKEHVLREAMDQHIRASQKIMEFRESNAKPIPNYNKLTCGYCSYVNLCDSIISGAPIEYQIAQDFQKRERYGYNTEGSNE